jgi:hypothetical protein
LTKSSSQTLFHEHDNPNLDPGSTEPKKSRPKCPNTTHLGREVETIEKLQNSDSTAEQTKNSNHVSLRNGQEVAGTLQEVS